MPVIYLSPSTQEFNEYITGGSEEYWMNLLADAMEPILTSSGIRYIRNTPDMTAASSILASNAGNYDLHLALHSNASGEGQAGQNRGILAFYYPGSAQGLRAAQLLVDGKIFHLSHGHHQNPEHLPPLPQGSVFLFGHTHVKLDRQVNGIRCLNPGSVSIPKDGSHSCLIYENGKFSFKILED